MENREFLYLDQISLHKVNLSPKFLKSGTGFEITTRKWGQILIFMENGAFLNPVLDLQISTLKLVSKMILIKY